MVPVAPKEATEDDYVDPKDIANSLVWQAAQTKNLNVEDPDADQLIPAFGLPGPPKPATYTFTLNSMSITNTRARHEDTDFVTASLAVGDQPPEQLTAALGNCNNGIHPINLTFKPVAVPDATTPVVLNYAIMNAGHKDPDKTLEAVHKELNDLAQRGAKALADLTAKGINSLVGVPLGTALLPVIGSALGALADWVLKEVWGVMDPDCDGPVAFEQAAMRGGLLWNMSSLINPWPVVTQHPGSDSANGCGSNSQYSTLFTYKRS